MFHVEHRGLDTGGWWDGMMELSGQQGNDGTQGDNNMAETFEVRFGDDLTDRITEIAQEAISNYDLNDLVGYGADPSDYFSMDDYDQRDAVDEVSADLETLKETVHAVKESLVVLVTALAKAGIVAKAEEPKAEQAQTTGYYGVA